MHFRAIILAGLLPAGAFAQGASAHYSLTASTLDAAGNAGMSTHYSHGGHLLSPAGIGASNHYRSASGFMPQIAPGLPGVLPAHSDAATATTGSTTIYPLANDGNPAASIIGVSDARIIIAGRLLIVPEGYTGAFAYTTSDGEIAVVTVNGGTPEASPRRFAGLLYDTSGALAGWSSATRSANGTYSAYIRIGNTAGGGRFRFPAGAAVTSGTAKKIGAFDAALEAGNAVIISVENGGDTLTGRLQPASLTSTIAIHNIGLGSIDAGVPGGGYAILRVKGNGIASYVGKLPDGLSFGGGGVISDNNRVSFYAPERSTTPTGFLGGEFVLADLATTDLTGEIAWNKPAQLRTSGMHLGGLETILTANGCAYTAPVLGLPDGPATLTLSGGDFPTLISTAVTLNSGLVTGPDPLVRWAAKDKNGRFEISVRPPGETRTTRGSGVYLPKSVSAFGWFKGTTVGGRVELTTP
jgi:hypothetical protein